MEAEMNNAGYLQFAEALVFVHGPRAEAEAAMHATLCERTGDMETAETWRQVQTALRNAAPRKAA
jgi:hypothetical protein